MNFGILKFCPLQAFSLLKINTENSVLLTEPLAQDSGLPPKCSVPFAPGSLIDALPLGADNSEQSTLCDGLSSNSHEICKTIVERSLSSSTAEPVYTAGVKHMVTEEIIEKRQNLLGPNMALFFADEPLHIIKGSGCELIDSEGHSYLDCTFLSSPYFQTPQLHQAYSQFFPSRSSIVAGINNVSHVGHSHPRVAAAVSQQLFTLNTHSRYLHEGLVTLAERLSETLPSPLQIVYPVVSGSEANDLAWRIACSYVEKHGLNQGKPLHVCVVDSGYHGHTSTVLDFSPYKFWGPGGRKKAAHVHVLPCPDVYREKHLDGKAAARNALAAAAAVGGHIAAFFCESIISCGGQIFLPDGWLGDVYTEMRRAGAVCVADEVQCGFGRVGNDFWAFQTHKQQNQQGDKINNGCAPDIVTMGKPMGNGFPCAAVATTPTLAAAFNNGMEFFATYGGCTAAAAAALTVLDVLRDENLLNNATEVGHYCMTSLKHLQNQYPDIIGDVRGLGLMIGVEIITSRATKEPAPATTAWVKSRCKTTHKVLLSAEGPYASVIKIKPPMCFSRADVDRMVAAMGEAFESVVGLSDKAAVELQKKNEEAVKEVQQRRAALGGYVDI